MTKEKIKKIKKKMDKNKARNVPLNLRSNQKMARALLSWQTGSNTNVLFFKLTAKIK